ncbi:hypothetical protein [Chryseobacterium sp. Alg-005]|uniref:hypothetical protein n=1 Tax=Chryseobacterium sp. Alg-005 TaxID=3159516 RepID=UPI0036F19D8F
MAHPSGANLAMQIALFNSHRFAFYFWNLWKRELLKHRLNANVDLITYDWHQDLVYPSDGAKEELKKLDLDNNFEVSFFSSYRLNTLNDSHIMSAVYLDIIGDVWVLCRQGTFESDWEDEYFEDIKGKKHVVRKFKTEDALREALLLSNVQNVFFDIDLDYFTLNNNIEPTDKFTYMKDPEIKDLLSIENTLIQWIFDRLTGITIALEPEFTGGISKSLKYLSLIEKLWFEKPLGNFHVRWKHLKE